MQARFLDGYTVTEVYRDGECWNCGGNETDGDHEAVFPKDDRAQHFPPAARPWLVVCPKPPRTPLVEGGERHE